MNILTQLIGSIYTQMLKLYPRRFRDEFSDEMQGIFRDSINDAAKEGVLSSATLCLRELGGLPFNILREFWHEFQGKELIMLPENTSSSPVTTGQVIMGTLPFFLFGIIMIMLELPFSLYDLVWFNSLGGYLFFVFLIMPAIGFGIGWAKNFPRWSYPYTGMAIVLAFYIQNGSTPGIKLFGIPIFGRELWGWRAWIPLAIAFIVALAVSRSFKPFIRFFTNIWNDWTIPSYLLLGVLPLLVAVVFDEMDRLYTLYFMIVFAVLFVGMVILYLRSQTAWQRVLILTLGVLAIVFPAVVGADSYGSIHLSISPLLLKRATIVTLIILLPAWLELLRRSVERLRSA